MLTQEPSGGLPLLVEGAVALGLGLFIGLEREHRHVDRPDGGPVILGVRSFALLALAGWLAGVLEPRWGWLPPVLLGLMGLLVVAQYLRESAGGERLGLTTEMAALLTMVYGLLVRHDVQLAVALSLVTTLVLISKPWVRGVVPRLLRMELVAALQFLIVAAVVLPLLPFLPPLGEPESFAERIAKWDDFRACTVKAYVARRREPARIRMGRCGAPRVLSAAPRHELR